MSANLWNFTRKKVILILKNTLKTLQKLKKHSDKPSSVVNAHLSSFVFANKIKRRVQIKTPTTPSCCGLGLQSRICCQNRWWAFTPPFHLCRKLALTAVCFLLHFPLGRPSHLLDEIPVFCSSDFPLRLRSEHLLCFGAIIHKNFYKFSHFHQILKHFLLKFVLKFTNFLRKRTKNGDLCYGRFEKGA